MEWHPRSTADQVKASIVYPEPLWLSLGTVGLRPGSDSDLAVLKGGDHSLHTREPRAQIRRAGSKLVAAMMRRTAER